MSNAAQISAAKAAFRAYLGTARHPAATNLGFFAGDARVNVVHPFNEMTREGFAETFLGGLGTSFKHLTRTDYIAFGGTYEGHTWVTSTGYYSGHFDRPWLGLRPTGTLAHLRFGEIHRVEGNEAVESYIYLDIPELMIAAGQWPISDSPGRERGFTGYLPGPITQDGLQWHDNDPQRSASSYEMVTAMLRSLATEDEAWRPYWHADMLWYGPAAFGSFAGIDNFAGFQVPFEQAFSEWVGGAAPGSRTRHFTRFADGDYVCSGGWPSLNAVQAKPFLGQPSEGKRLYMRVCDWWRREGDLLAENWVFVDIPHVLLQMGFDVFATLEEAA
ncbi:nuclear transport factor 2 family protein [Nitratireductor sp. XY-223]|uniref:nuclear transport factor 2 family protein n=1 Tax=Nitratireductor sp. XY-223 TaxID=2561926 RepID=UPI0010AA0662|nr:nuclear transport factor 2 family protein [Nitratireductor sp. XY-223]